MPSTQKDRGNVDVVLNRRIREDVITGFKTDFGYDNETASPSVTISVPEGRSPEEVEALVIKVVMEEAIGIDVTVERT